MKFGILRCSYFLLFFVGLVVGCGGDQVSESFREMNKLNIQKLVNSYVMFASVNDNTGPQSAEELKNFIATDERVPPRLGMSSSDLANLDSIFISDADGKPFKIRFGLKIRPDEDRSPLIFDAVGVDGVRRVGLADNEIVEVSNSEKYDRMWAGKMTAKEAGADESEIAAGEDVELE